MLIEFSFLIKQTSIFLSSRHNKEENYFRNFHLSLMFAIFRSFCSISAPLLRLYQGRKPLHCSKTQKILVRALPKPASAFPLMNLSWNFVGHRCPYQFPVWIGCLGNRGFGRRDCPAYPSPPNSSSELSDLTGYGGDAENGRWATRFRTRLNRIKFLSLASLVYRFPHEGKWRISSLLPIITPLMPRIWRFYYIRAWPAERDSLSSKDHHASPIVYFNGSDSPIQHLKLFPS